jgi:hypothetical protein
MKQTAVEWLLNEIDMQYPHINIRWKQIMIQQALEMEKQQIIAAVEWNYKSNMGEVYYNAVYKNEQI